MRDSAKSISGFSRVDVVRYTGRIFYSIYTKIFYTTNLTDAITLGGAHDGGEASPVGLQVHVICCSGR